MLGRSVQAVARSIHVSNPSTSIAAATVAARSALNATAAPTSPRASSTSTSTPSTQQWYQVVRPSQVLRSIRLNRPLQLAAASYNNGHQNGNNNNDGRYYSAHGSQSGVSEAYRRRWVQWFAVMASAGLVILSQWRSTRACGIVGVVGPDPAVDYLIEGLQILQNRGYDSAGCATLGEGKLTWTKYASQSSTSDCIDLLKKTSAERHTIDGVGIAHTRWATHGAKTDANAHPHLDQKGRVALVHNGTIENADALKKELQRKGVVFHSQTDTEVIAQMIGSYLEEGLPIMESVNKTLSRLEGTWGLAIIHRDSPGQVIAARNGSPLVVGIGKDRHFIASEPTAFSRHTTQFISLKDGEVAVVKANGVSLDLGRVEHAHAETIELSPAPYPHWTIKEIMEQPEAIERTLANGSRLGTESPLVRLGGLQGNAEKLLPIRSLVIAACGTSQFAGLYGMKLMQQLRSFDNVSVLDASEITADSLPTKGGGLLAISQSGETKDTHRSVTLAEQYGLPIFSVVNQVGSLIARTTNCGVYLNAGREHAVASTKAFTTQVTALALIAGWFSQNRLVDGVDVTRPRREEVLDAVRRLPVATRTALGTRPQCQELAEKLKTAEHLFILGKGFAEPIAYEGALKIKEITYIHAEGYSGGALKHGPFALLDRGTPVILLVLDDQHAELMRIAAAEVRARGARTIVITDKKSLSEGISDEVIYIPSNGPMTALVAAIPLQLLAYEIAIKKGFNPDKPRNLAKAVTVD